MSTIPRLGTILRSEFAVQHKEAMAVYWSRFILRESIKSPVVSQDLIHAFACVSLCTCTA